MVILSRGMSRSASTYQFVLACMLGRVCAAREDSKAVRCFAGFDDAITNPYARVIKTHDAIPIPAGAYVFHMLARRTDRFEPPVDYAAHLDNFADVGFQTQVHEVSRLFGLTKAEEHLISHYMRWWSVLRQCCGTQSSADHRMKLHGATGYTEHHAPFSPTSPSCELYNRTAVEEELLRSPLAQGFVNSVSSGALSKDPPIKVGMCEEADAKIRAGLDFNGAAWRPSSRISSRAQIESLQRLKQKRFDHRPLA
jgi:hypothetical protein